MNWLSKPRHITCDTLGRISAEICKDAVLNMKTMIPKSGLSPDYVVVEFTALAIIAFRIALQDIIGQSRYREISATMAAFDSHLSRVVDLRAYERTLQSRGQQYYDLRLQHDDAISRGDWSGFADSLGHAVHRYCYDGGPVSLDIRDMMDTARRAIAVWTAAYESVARCLNRQEIKM